MFCVTKSTSINLRISPEFRVQIEELAEFHGLTLSSIAHSLLVKAVRHERQELGIASQRERTVNIKSSPVAPHSKKPMLQHIDKPTTQNKRRTG